MSKAFRKSLENSIESSSQVGGFYMYWEFEPTLQGIKKNCKENGGTG